MHIKIIILSYSIQSTSQTYEKKDLCQIKQITVLGLHFFPTHPNNNGK